MVRTELARVAMLHYAFEVTQSITRSSPEDFHCRRKRIAERLARENAALLIYGGDLKTRSNDSDFGFRPDSNFYYLSGLAEPGAIMFLTGEQNGELTLFVRPRDPVAETWSGRRVGPEGAQQRFGAHRAFPLQVVSDELPELLDGKSRIYASLGQYPEFDRLIFTAQTNLRRRNRDGTIVPETIVHLDDILAEDRMIKDTAALACLRHAIHISATAHRETMACVKPGMTEFQLQAELEYHFRYAGSEGPGYSSIVAGGDNATILHYVENSMGLKDGELVLIDAGAEWDYFTGDITRTFPVNGKFNDTQRQLYSLVLAANEAGIAACTPGQTIDGVHQICVDILCQGLLDLGILKGSLAEIKDKELYKKYYMHRSSHWLGIDVHDAGSYCIDRKPRPFAENYVLTVEPALYIRKNDESVAPEFRGIGIRIEDDVRVTHESPEVLSSEVPKSISAIEALIAESSDSNQRSS